MTTVQPPAAPEWLTTRERSNRLALQLMAWIAVTGGRRVARWLLHPITLYYLSCAPRPRRHSARYLQRALGRPPTWRDLYRHIHAFASVVLDRVYFARGQMQRFDLRVQGGELVDETLAGGRGAFFLGAHLGSFEALHAIGATRPGMRVAHVMYPDNARMIHATLAAIAPDFQLSIIPIGRSGSTLQIRDWLDGGGLVGLLGDRWLPSDAARAASGREGLVTLPFLGQPARFIDGPLRLAQLLRRRVLFMAGLYLGGNRYDLRFDLLADFSQPARDAAEREAQLQAALQAYVARLEALCREAPTNWFNFYDFWNEDPSRA
jgi:predicted LPLAT superfamily acyltransferase